MKNRKIRLHIFVFGKVQGVFFRQEIKQKAIQYNISGWVKNFINTTPWSCLYGNRDQVEIVLEGEKNKVKKIVKWIKQGPPLAKVESIDITQEEYKNEFINFIIKY